MNKSELVNAIAAKVVGSTRKEIDLLLSAAVEAIEAAVASGDKVTLVGFGSFEPRERKEREGRNPQTGESIKISATRVPAFSPGKVFKQKVGAV